VFAARFLYSALIFRSIPDADPLPYLEAWQASPLADGESLLMLASTHVYRGDTDTALTLLKDTLNLSDATFIAEAAFVAYRAGDYDAVGASELASNPQPANVVGSYVLGLVSWYAYHILEVALRLLESVQNVDG